MQPNHTFVAAKTENPVLFYNCKSFAQMMTHLSRQKFIALDTESDSLFRYYPKVCLIQITSGGDPRAPGSDQVVDYLLDPLRLQDIHALELVLADPAIEKIMHAAENDILTLQRSFDFTIKNVFDTQLAARILGWKRLGLAAILEEQFGVVSDKRMQRTDWGKRPLTPQQIAYAQMDTHYLPTLRAILAAELDKRARWEEAQESFTRFDAIRHTEYEDHERSFWNMKGVRDLPREALGLLAALWSWRESEAQRKDRPPFKIANDEVLVRLALAKPSTEGELRAMGGLSSQQIDMWAKDILRAVAAGQHQQPPPPPQPTHRPEYELDNAAVQRFEQLRKWRTQVAETREVTPDVIFTNDTLLSIVRQMPERVEDLLTIPEIGPWRARTYGPAILAQLHNA